MFAHTEEVTIGPKGHIVIPACIRYAFNLAPGDILIITSDRNGRISLAKKPKQWAIAVWGCCKGAWGDNPLASFKQERESDI